MATIAWLGTGLLGSGFVKAALGRGETVRVWNRTLEKTEPLRLAGAVVATTPVEAVLGAQRVHLCLSDDAAVDGVLEQLLAIPGFVGPIIDHSTVTPKGAEARAKRLAERGVGFLTCPVFMAPANAVTMTGRMLCAGPAALVQQLAPSLRVMTGEFLVMGADVRLPCTIKLVGNAMIIGLTAVLADTFAIGEGGGVSPAEVLRFVSALPIANILNGRGAKMVQGDYAASFELSMARKDVRLMQETAGSRPLATLDGLAARMDTLVEKGHGAKDLAVLSIDTIPSR